MQGKRRKLVGSFFIRICYNNKMRYDAILFDLDGTLLNTLDDLADSVNHVMETMGYPLHSVDEIREFVGNGIRNLMVCSVPKGEDNPEFEEAFSEFKRYYLLHNQIKTRPYEDVIDVLAALEQKGIPMAIVTNKNQPSVDVLLRDMFEGHIRVAVGDDGKRRRKPDAAPVKEALYRLRETSKDPLKRVLYVGDSEVDAATAKNAGVDCVLCSWGFRPPELLKTLTCVAIVDTPKELLEFIMK